MRVPLSRGLFLAAVILSFVGGHGCNHDFQLDRFKSSVNMKSLTNEQTLEPSLSESSRRLSDAAAASTAFNPIRISFDVSFLTNDPGYLCKQVGDMITRDGSNYACTQNDLLTKDKSDFILTVLLPAVSNYFKNVLSVQSVVGNLKIQGIGCQSTEWACCSSTIPPYLSSQGIANTDFLIHVTARPTSGAVLAWALPCNIDQFGRPISGQTNFGPNRLDTSIAARAGQIGTAIHEITHALGFSSSRFQDFRQPLNGPKWGYDNVVSQTQQNGIYVTKITTPLVVKQAKQQFNCQNWPNAGAELENGPTGSSDYSSHWEKRLFHNEYMTATASSNPVYSAMTLAFFEDTGWYIANYSAAQTLTWGYLEGCSFATSQCSGWSSDYFCSQAGEHCSATRDAKGYCDINTYTSSIPSGFQYFSNNALGGQDSYADYCPQYQGYSNGACTDTTAYLNPNMGEELGVRSQCFMATLGKGSSVPSGPVCYPVLQCTQNTMVIRVGGTQVSCPLAGGDITVPGFQGTVRCPPANKICQLLQTQCSGRGILQVDGSCACNPGYAGTDCSLKDCPATNGVQCSNAGTCDRKTGTCTCDALHTGLSCAELLCPAVNDKKLLDQQCSGRGTCNPTSGTCTCSNGYTGKACECVPGCTSCSNNGQCDCMTGSCVCPSGFFGPKCQSTGNAAMTTLTLDGPVVSGTAAAKTYTYFKVLLQSSSSDITIVLTSTSGDADLYGSFAETYPTPQSPKASLFVSNANRTDGLDEIQLCGTLGNFPRAINDTFRFCSQPNTLLVQGAPGYFYIAVFGFSSARFTIQVQSDPCVNETCSGHGQCGKYFAGVCACNRLWSGEQCSTPRCRPDCIDFGTCNDPTKTATLGATIASSGLRNSTDCYGNGVCQVQLVNGIEQPTCVCDDAFFYHSPTDAQSMCKVPIPSINYIQHFGAPFTVHGNTLDLQVPVGAWAVYTLDIQPSWQYLYVELTEMSSGSDPLVLVRKTKLPSLDVLNPNPYQSVDADAWTTADSKQRILLSRAGSTLSDGLLYIGVYNTRYARSNLAYDLVVEANATCDTSTSSVCRGAAGCNVNVPTLCQCSPNALGLFCDLEDIPHASVTMAASPLVVSSIVVREGEWEYLTFDVPDPQVQYLQLELTTRIPDPDIQSLLLARGPQDPGFPSLDLSSEFDFNALSTHNGTQVVVLPVTTACTGATCFKVAIHNKLYSGNVLQATLTVRGLASIAAAFPVSDCSATGQGDNENCNGRGTCVQVGGQPSCKCKNGWSGLSCNAPQSFAISELWFAAANITLLCSVCQASFTLANGLVTMYALPQSMQPNTGLEVRVSAHAEAVLVSPNIYVSEVLPRSIYDFSMISFADASDQVVRLTSRPLEGHFWVAIYSEAPLSKNANTTDYTTFKISSRVIPLAVATADKTLITQSSFFGSVFTWLTSAPSGIALFSVLLIFFALILFYFVWRTFRAPDNQDSAIETLAVDLGNAVSRPADAQILEDGVAPRLSPIVPRRLSPDGRHRSPSRSPLRPGQSFSDDIPTPSAPPMDLADVDVEMGPGAAVRFS
ncbi:Aste57867_22895 [Aphanomyces stellatus]|uniref:Aste57867_22895 protein n=1 Tax=Aphanomyces stellatus TaxID=120398 RepID=A0A485LN52_9STRA|nr:hypothetical protein As57867_022824 [Aphanomyces stellatus]VFT99545.1 Aste57867_22895 [Aphanomyces stellatus]